MPPKRLAENPPPVSSSSEEEEEEEEKEEEEEEEECSDKKNDSVAEEQNGGVDKDDEEDDEEEEEEEEKEEEKSTAIASPQKSGSGSDSDSEATQPSAFPSALKNKFHKPNKSGSKRLAESDSVKEAPSPPSKRRNKGGGGGGGDDEETKNKGSAIQRLWSEDDEIVILKGLSQYKSEKGADPSADMVAFHDFIKKSLHVDASKNQLMDKIRRLKKKYQNNLERAEIGRDPFFSKPHDEKSFELSKKVWEENVKQSKKVSEENIKQSGKIGNNAGSFSGITLGLASQGKGQELRARKPMRAPNGEMNNSVLKREENPQVKSKEEKDEIVEEFLWEKYPFLRESLEIEGLSEDVKVTLREQLGIIEKEKLEELEDKWKKLKKAQLELFVQRMELVHEQVKLTLDSMK